MPNRGALRAAAKRLILAIPSTMTDTIVDEWVQGAVRYAEDRHGFRFMEATLSMTTNAAGLAHEIGTKDSRWLRRRADPYYITGTGKEVPFSWLTNDEEMRKLYDESDPTQDGSPKHLVERESDFQVFPLADGNNPSGTLYSDGEYRIRVPYYQRSAAFTVGTGGDSETNWLTDHAGDFITWYAASEGMLFNRDREEFLTARARAEAELARVIRLDKRSRFASGMTFGAWKGPNAARL